jgi:hypothetical protein
MIFQEVFIIICLADELTIDPQAVIALFLHQHSSYYVLADAMHLQILKDDGVATTDILTSSAIISTI